MFGRTTSISRFYGHPDVQAVMVREANQCKARWEAEQETKRALARHARRGLAHTIDLDENAGIPTG